MKPWTDRLPQVPFPCRGLPADSAWMTQDAAAHPGTGVIRAGWLLSNQHLNAVRTTTPGHLVATRASVDAEQRWRATASAGQKAWGLLKDTLNGL